MPAILHTNLPKPLWLDAGGCLTPPPNSMIGKVPQFACLSLSPDEELSGFCKVKAPLISHFNGWIQFSVHFTSQIFPFDYNDWIRVIKRDSHYFDTTLPDLPPEQTLHAYITRDAIGWAYGLPQTAEKFRTNGITHWPWLWLRQPISSHDTFKRMERLEEDLEWLSSYIAPQTP